MIANCEIKILKNKYWPKDKMLTEEFFENVENNERKITYLNVSTELTLDFLCIEQLRGFADNRAGLLSLQTLLKFWIIFLATMGKLKED